MPDVREALGAGPERDGGAVSAKKARGGVAPSRASGGNVTPGGGPGPFPVRVKYFV